MHVYQSTIGYVIWSTQEPSVCPNSLANYRRREILLYWFDISNRTGAKSSQPYQMGRWCHWFYGWSILTYRMHPIQWVKPQTTTGIITIQWSITSFASLLPLRLYIARINFPGSWHEAQVNQSLIRQVVHNIGDKKIVWIKGSHVQGISWTNIWTPFHDGLVKIYNLRIEGPSFVNTTLMYRYVMLVNGAL